MSKIFLIVNAILSISLFFLLLLFYDFNKINRTNNDIFIESLNIAKKYDATSNKIINIAEYFMGCPYTDTPSIENLKTFSNVDFVEKLISLSLSSKRHDSNFQSFQLILKKIRYTGTQSNQNFNSIFGWTANLVNRNITINLTEYYEGVEVNSKSKNYYIPKDDIGNIETKIMDGDIVILVSPSNPTNQIMGIIKMVNCRPHLIYVTKQTQKVVLSPVPITKMTENDKDSGIVLLRLN